MPVYACPRCGASVEGSGAPDMTCPSCGYPNPPRWGEAAPAAGAGTPAANAPAAAGWAAPPRSDDNVLGMLVHLLALLTGFLGPLILWLVKKDESAFVDRHGRSALNWQFTVLLVVGGAFLVSFMLMLVLIGFVLFPLAILLAVAASIANIVFCILAAVRAYEGKDYRYPMSIRFLRW